MESAFKDSNYDWYSCRGHILNRVLVCSFQDLDKIESLKTIHKLLSNTRSLVEYCKRSSKNNFKISLKQDISTRWDSVFIHLNSILINKDQLLSSKDNKINQLVKLIDFNILEKLADLLKVFYESRLALCTSSKSTFQLILPVYKSILDSQEPLEDEDDRIVDLKQRLKDNLILKYSIDIKHELAT